LWAADNSPRGASFCFTLPTKAEADEWHTKSLPLCSSFMRLPRGLRSYELNYRTEFVTPADRRCPREERPRKRDRQSWREV